MCISNSNSCKSSPRVPPATVCPFPLAFTTAFCSVFPALSRPRKRLGLGAGSMVVLVSQLDRCGGLYGPTGVCCGATSTNPNHGMLQSKLHVEAPVCSRHHAPVPPPPRGNGSLPSCCPQPATWQPRGPRTCVLAGASAAPPSLNFERKQWPAPIHLTRGPTRNTSLIRRTSLRASRISIRKRTVNRSPKRSRWTELTSTVQPGRPDHFTSC